MRTRPAALLALGLLAALPGCGGTSPGPDVAVPAQDGADEVVLLVDRSGGLRVAGADLVDLPALVVYADGRALVPGPVPAVYPGPALPPVLQAQLPPDEVDALVAGAVDAGVTGGPRDYGQPPVADATTTTVVVRGPDGVASQSVYALAETPGPPGSAAPGPGLSQEQADARADLAAYVDRALAQVDAGAAYEPDRMAVVRQAYTGEPASDVPEPREVTWSGPELDGEGPFPCTVLEGDGLAAVRPDLERATTATRWLVDGSPQLLQLRPLLPHEAGCEDLADPPGAVG